MNKFCTTLMFFLLGSASVGFAQSPSSMKAIEKDLNKLLEITEAPGFAVAVVKGNETIYAKGFGYRDKDNKIPMDENTLLYIGSSTKAFTCSVLGQLRDEEKLSFYDSPRDYVSNLKFYNGELNNGVNIQDLMAHRTGIPRHDTSWYLFPSGDRDSLIQRIQYLEPFTGLRQKWYYNNFMYILQGVIAENITGKTWEENIKERFFKPLGMKRTLIAHEEVLKSSDVAIGYDKKGRQMDYYDLKATAPAGSIVSSVNEMTNWLKLWVNKGKFNNQEILSELYVKEAMSSHAIATEALPKEEVPNVYMYNYGYGWFVNSYKGHYLVEHGGNIDGFSANVGFYPTDSIGIVVLTNQNGSSIPTLVRNTISDHLLGVNKTDWADIYAQKVKGNGEEESSDDTSEAKKPSKPSHPLKDYVGSFFNPGYGNLEVVMENDSLFMESKTLKTLKLYLNPTYYDVFSPLKVTKYGVEEDELLEGVYFNFSTNNSGEIDAVKVGLEPALNHPIEFKRQIKQIEVASSSLDVYEGEYEISGVAIKIYKKGDSLFALVPGQPEYTLLPSAKDEFIIKGVDGYKVKFKRTTADKISGILFVQPNGTFEAKKK